MKKSKLKVSNQAELVDVPKKILYEVKRINTLDNPKFKDAEKYGRYTGHLEPTIKLWSETSEGISFPRGWSRNCLDLLSRNGIDVNIEDLRRSLSPVELIFKGELRDYQQKAIDGVLKRGFGVLESATGSGKTIMALKIVAERQQPTLILVHTKELLHQWKEKIQEFLDIEAGLIGDGKYKIQPVTVGIVNTVRKRLGELPEHFGQIIVDECHRTPSTMFTEVVQAFDCKYMLGLSATAYRRDGLTKIIYLTLGDRTYQVNSKELKSSGAVMSPEIIQRQTNFYYSYEDDYQEMITSLTQDMKRNTQIAEDVIQQATNRSGTCLVVSERIQHCEDLADMIQKRTDLRVEILIGHASRSERENIVNEVQEGEIDVLVSTIQLIGEGFDCKGLSSLFLTTPIKFKGRLLQVIGRILRPADGKRPRVYDYQDQKVGVLKAQAKSREWALREVEAY